MRFMPSKSADTALRDILYHIDLAAHFAAGLDYERFQQDMRTVYAVTRCLEIISEASRRLPEAMKSRHPSIAWREASDRKSTRLNSSHQIISYAVFCLKKKKKLLSRQMRCSSFLPSPYSGPTDLSWFLILLSLYHYTISLIGISASGY